MADHYDSRPTTSDGRPRHPYHSSRRSREQSPLREDRRSVHSGPQLFTDLIAHPSESEATLEMIVILNQTHDTLVLRMITSPGL